MSADKINLPINAKNSIISLAKKYDINKVVLFGSRARGDNRERSDIDLAITGGDVTGFACGIEDEADTLLMFDVVDLDSAVQKELLDVIKKEGVIIYEKV